jgi:hypothetical protein
MTDGAAAQTLVATEPTSPDTVRLVTEPMAAAQPVLAAAPTDSARSPTQLVVMESMTALREQPISLPTSVEILPAVTEPELEVVESLTLTSTREALRPPVVDSWIQALEVCFTEDTWAAAPSRAAEETAPPDEWTTLKEGDLPLAGLGLVLGGLWAARPEPKPGHSRKEKDQLIAGSH